MRAARPGMIRRQRVSQSNRHIALSECPVIRHRIRVHACSAVQHLCQDFAETAKRGAGDREEQMVALTSRLLRRRVIAPSRAARFAVSSIATKYDTIRDSMICARPRRSPAAVPFTVSRTADVRTIRDDHRKTSPPASRRHPPSCHPRQSSRWRCREIDFAVVAFLPFVKPDRTPERFDVTWHLRLSNRPSHQSQ